MHKDCRSALIAMTGAIGLAAAIIAVGVSAGTIISNDTGYRMLKSEPAFQKPLGRSGIEYGKPAMASYLSNRS